MLYGTLLGALEVVPHLAVNRETSSGLSGLVLLFVGVPCILLFIGGVQMLLTGTADIVCAGAWALFAVFTFVMLWRVGSFLFYPTPNQDFVQFALRDGLGGAVLMGIPLAIVIAASRSADLNKPPSLANNRRRFH